MDKDIPWIDGTPLGVDIRRISFIAPHRHENLIEITMCLTGEIQFSYYFEEFTLRPGEFILVDKDVHYLYGGEAVCASFYIDLNWFKERFPYIDSLMFVCEGTSESTVPHNTYYHKYLKSILLAVLFYISEQPADDPASRAKVTDAAEKIIKLMMDHFDILFFYEPQQDLKAEVMERYRRIIQYLNDHCQDKLTLEELAAETGLSAAYLSEFLGKVTLGFRMTIGYMRAYKSEQYLMETDLSITEISEACGFSDTKYYYEAFKKWYHCTPGQFRRKYRSEMGRGNEFTRIDIASISKTLGKMMETHFVDMFL